MIAGAAPMKLLLCACVASSLLGMQGTAGAARGDDLYTRPGQIVPAGDGARLNLYCMGSGSATVVFDSGSEDWAPAWAVVQPQIAKWARACSYDRAGAGFSSAGPMPRTSVRIAGELHSALHRAGIKGPASLSRSRRCGEAAAAASRTHRTAPSHLRAAVLSWSARSRVVAGSECEAIADRANEGRDVRRIHIGNGANGVG